MAMSGSRIKDKTIEAYDLQKLPRHNPLDFPVKVDFQVTISDLHANFLKLLSVSMLAGIMVEERSAQPGTYYAALVKIYHSSFDVNELHQLKFAEDMLEQFDHILFKKMRVNPAAFLRLIGDEFADRGRNDFFVLKIIKKLVHEKVRLEILLSNHGIEFIKHYETQADLRDQERTFIDTDQTQSAFACVKLLTTFPHLQKEMREMIDLYYKPCLKVLSYTLSEDKQSISILSHAAIDLEVIEAMAKKLNVAYKDATAEELANTIDEINRVFQTEYVQKNKVHTLYTGRTTQPNEQDKVNHPFTFVMWNRDYTILKRPAKHPNGGYAMSFGHGHDSKEATHENIFVVDDNAGKELDSMGRANPSATLRVLQSWGHTKVLDLKVDQVEQKTVPRDTQVSPLVVDFKVLEASIAEFKRSGLIYGDFAFSERTDDRVVHIKTIALKQERFSGNGFGTAAIRQLMGQCLLKNYQLEVNSNEGSLLFFLYMGMIPVDFQVKEVLYDYPSELRKKIFRKLANSLDPADLARSEYLPVFKQMLQEYKKIGGEISSETVFQNKEFLLKLENKTGSFLQVFIRLLLEFLKNNFDQDRSVWGNFFCRGRFQKTVVTMVDSEEGRKRWLEAISTKQDFQKFEGFEPLHPYMTREQKLQLNELFSHSNAISFILHKLESQLPSLPDEKLGQFDHSIRSQVSSLIEEIQEMVSPAIDKLVKIKEHIVKLLQIKQVEDSKSEPPYLSVLKKIKNALEAEGNIYQNLENEFANNPKRQLPGPSVSGHS